MLDRWWPDGMVCHTASDHVSPVRLFLLVKCNCCPNRMGPGASLSHWQWCQTSTRRLSAFPAPADFSGAEFPEPSTVDLKHIYETDSKFMHSCSVFTQANPRDNHTFPVGVTIRVFRVFVVVRLSQTVQSKVGNFQHKAWVDNAIWWFQIAMRTYVGRMQVVHAL